MVTTLLETRQSSAERGEGGQVPCQFKERARGHTTTGRRPSGGGTSRQSVTKQSRKSQSWRRHGALARCCGRSSLATGHRGTATIDRRLGSSSTPVLNARHRVRTLRFLRRKRQRHPVRPPEPILRRVLPAPGPPLHVDDVVLPRHLAGEVRRD